MNKLHGLNFGGNKKGRSQKKMDSSAAVGFIIIKAAVVLLSTLF
jgi:hypothetical protein